VGHRLHGLLLGAAANALASRTQTVPLVLSPGATAQITVYRLIDDQLRLRLRYAADGTELTRGAAAHRYSTDHGDFRAGSVREWPGRASTAAGIG
jgi:hypothetical protein